MSEIEHPHGFPAAVPEPAPPRPNVWTDLYDRDIERLTDERDEARRQLRGAVDLVTRLLASFDDDTIDIPDVANAAVAEMREFLAANGGR